MSKILFLWDFQRISRHGTDWTGVEGRNFEWLCSKAEITDSTSVYLWPDGDLKKETELLGTSSFASLLKKHKEQGGTVAVLFGALVCREVLGHTQFKGIRGTVFEHDGLKVIVTYHPDNVMQDWSSRQFILMDMLKAKRESGFAGLKRISRKVYWVESVADAEQHLRVIKSLDAPVLATDVETKHNQITSAAIAHSPEEVFVYTFRNKENRHYWSAQDEAKVKLIIKEILETPGTRHVFHNASYDLAYLLREGIYPVGDIHDTMLMSHSTQPEWPKSLGFLASLHTNEVAWKPLNSFNKEK